MAALRPFALVRTTDQWLRAAFQNTTLDLDTGAVGLAWTDPAPVTAGGEQEGPSAGAGLAFDAECRLYHSLPTAGRVERVLWGRGDSARPAEQRSEPAAVVGVASAPVLGDVTPPAAPDTPLQEPRGLAVDVNDRLFIAETGASSIVVYDLWSRRLLRRVDVAPAHPVDLAVHGSTVFALLVGPAGLVRFTASASPKPVALPPDVTSPSRIAVSAAGALVLLEHAGTAAARVVPLDRPADAFVVEYATDVEFLDRDTLVVARRPGDDFLRFRLGPGSRAEEVPLKPRGYDGLGIVRTPDGRIGFWTAHGFRHAVAARVTYKANGRVTTFRLDSGEFQTVWGRLFLDACIPADTEIRAHFITADEPADEAVLPRTPPATVQTAVIFRPDLSPPMPPASAVPDEAAIDQLLHRRESGRELPWTQPPAEDPYETYEAPVRPPAGRYLWVTLELRGNTRITPRVKSVRAEHPSHDYLRRLPRTFSRDERVADFLLRFLAMFEGFLGEIEARAADRHMLIDARSAPDEILPWVASFVGLVLDDRWPVAARRTLIREAVALFRARGTVPGLKRFLEIYTGVPVVIIELYQLRGLGGALLGSRGAAFTSSVLGAGFRIGGAVGVAGEAPLAGTLDDAFKTHAHRFSVIVPAALSTEQRDVVEHILEVHRPAHTTFDLCTVGAGMRVGLGLHIGLSAVIGRTGAFAPLQIGAAALGRGATLGRAVGGGSPDANRPGAHTRSG